MGKKIESPVEHFPGHVIIADPMTMPQVLALEEALQKAGVYFEDEDGKRVLKHDVMWGAPDSEYMKSVFLCVEEWHLGNVPEGVNADTFPFTPRVPSHQLIQWLMSEILDVYFGEVKIPNE